MTAGMELFQAYTLVVEHQRLEPTGAGSLAAADILAHWGCTSACCRLKLANERPVLGCVACDRTPLFFCGVTQRPSLEESADFGEETTSVLGRPPLSL